MRGSALVPLLPIVAALLGACGGNEVRHGNEGGSGPGEPAAATTSFEAGPFAVAAGGEEVVCSFFRMDNDAPVDVNRLTGRQTEGGHHLVAYTVDHPIESAPIACPQGGQPGWTMLFATQLPEETVAMPDGVGLTLAPHQQIVLETHFINATDRELQVTSSVELEHAAEGSVKERAAVFLFGTTNIDVAPRSSAQGRATCSPPDDIHLFRLFGHEHRLGAGVRVEVGPKGGPLEEIYVSKDWEDPPVQELRREVGPGSSVRVTCDWDNPTDARVMYPDEMCFAVGMYWPSQGQLFCTTSGLREECRCFYTGTRHLGPGSSEVTVRVGREDHIPGVQGDPTGGHHLYCRLYLPEDWDKSGIDARPAYTADVGHVPLARATDRAELTFHDVSPGHYQLYCFMDTVGGGFVPGPGAPSFTGDGPIVVEEGGRETIDVRLNAAVE